MVEGLWSHPHVLYVDILEFFFCFLVFLVHANMPLNMVVLENTMQGGDFLKLQSACIGVRVCSCHYLNLRMAAAVYMYCACAINCLLNIVMSSMLTNVGLVLLTRYFAP